MSAVEGVRGSDPAPPVFPMPGRRVENGYRIVAADGADLDGGTLYTLLDETGCPVASAAWPQPLEAIAASRLDVWRP